MSDNPPYDCSDCSDKKREVRNCHNRQHFASPLLLKEDWKSISATHKHILKVGDLKFFECPASAITRKTWDIISLVNETTNTDGDILHLPFDGTFLDQPSWYREAVRVTRRERAQHTKESMRKAREK